jgi:hypothetical protein
VNRVPRVGRRSARVVHGCVVYRLGYLRAVLSPSTRLFVHVSLGGIDHGVVRIRASRILVDKESVDEPVL